MNITDTLTSVLSEDSISGLNWVEYDRRDIRKLLGLKPEEGFPEDIFGGKTPDDFGDDIWYQIVTDKVIIDYWRKFQRTYPISFEHFLRLTFAETPDGVRFYDHPLADVEGFEYLRKLLLLFTFEIYPRTETPYVQLGSLNLGFHNEGRFQRDRNTFTETGVGCMEAILAQKDRIVGIPGLEPAYSGALKQYLDVLEQQYRQNKIEPRRM